MILGLPVPVIRGILRTAVVLKNRNRGLVMCGRVESMQTSVAGDVVKWKEVEGIFIRENDNLPVLAATWMEQAPFVCRRLKGLPTPRAGGHDDEKMIFPSKSHSPWVYGAQAHPSEQHRIGFTGRRRKCCQKYTSTLPPPRPAPSERTPEAPTRADPECSLGCLPLRIYAIAITSHTHLHRLSFGPIHSLP